MGELKHMSRKTKSSSAFLGLAAKASHHHLRIPHVGFLDFRGSRPCFPHNSCALQVSSCASDAISKHCAWMAFFLADLLSLEPVTGPFTAREMPTLVRLREPGTGCYWDIVFRVCHCSLASSLKSDMQHAGEGFHQRREDANVIWRLDEAATTELG